MEFRASRTAGKRGKIFKKGGNCRRRSTNIIVNFAQIIDAWAHVNGGDTKVPNKSSSLKVEETETFSCYPLQGNWIWSLSLAKFTACQDKNNKYVFKKIKEFTPSAVSPTQYPLCCAVLCCFGHVWLSAMWAGERAHQAPLSMGFPRARILEWAAMPFSRGSSQLWDQTHVSLCLLHWQAGSLPLVPLENPTVSTTQ